MMFSSLRFGPAGIPICVKGNCLDAINWIGDKKFGCNELEFVHSVWLKEETAKELSRRAKQHDVALTAHGSYYINLNSAEPQKRGASRSRIIQAAKALDSANGFSLTFHPAFYAGQSSEHVLATVKDQCTKLLAEMREHSLKVRLSPETTGKPTQFGTVDELTQLAAEFSNEIGLCVDFAHLHARTNGKHNSYDEHASVLELIEKRLGNEGLHTMHIHMSGIAYGEKGEKNHLLLKESDFNTEELIRAWKDFGIKGCVICESPIMEDDAQYMKDLYESL